MKPSLSRSTRTRQSLTATLKARDRVPVCIPRRLSRDGQIPVSINQGLKHHDCLRAQDLLKSGRLPEAQLTGANRGGLVVSSGHVRGFVPNSHLKRLRSRKLEAKSKLLGQTLSLVVLEVNQRRRLVLSEHVANVRRRQQLLEELAGPSADWHRTQPA